MLADEITQQVLIKVHESLNELENGHKLQSWLRKIIYNTLMNHYPNFTADVQPVLEALPVEMTYVLAWVKRYAAAFS